MRSLKPVVWREGMHLAHHHFQLRDRYFEDSSTFAVSSLVFKPYGLTRLELDHEALLNGTVALVHAAGVMPDGLAFSFPDEALPPSLDIQDLFSPTAESHRVLLTVPSYRPGRANCSIEPTPGGAATRYVPEVVDVSDETTGLDEKQITIAKKNFRLALDAADLDDVVALPLATVRRDRSGNFVYEPHYIPACLHIGASSRIMELLRRLIEGMEAKAAALAAERGSKRTAAEFAPDEITNYWLSHAIQSGLPPLRHHFEARTTHPEELYMELLRVSGALCTFSLQARPEDLALYDHDELQECFGALEQHIRSHLTVVLPRRALRIELEPLEQPAEVDSDGAVIVPAKVLESFFSGSIPDPRSFDDASWFLEARIGSGSHAEAISRVPQLVKICSARHIVRLVQTAHSGMGLEHVPSPPAEISPQLGTEYFRIETDPKEPCWVALEKSLEAGDPVEVGVYVPERLADLELAILIALGV